MLGNPYSYTDEATSLKVLFSSLDDADTNIHIILNPTQKIQLCIQQHHSKVGTDAIVIVILMRQSDAGLMQSSFRTTEKTTTIKYLLDHKLLEISGLKKKKILYPYL